MEKIYPRNVGELTEEQIIEIAKEETKKIGYEFVKMKSLPHPSDNYLKYVMGYKEKEYGVWLLNLEMGGLHWGHYFDFYFGQRTKEETYQVALADFKSR